MTLTTAIVLVALITVGCLIGWLVAVVLLINRTLRLNIFRFAGKPFQQIVQEIREDIQRGYRMYRDSVFARLIVHLQQEYREHPEMFETDDEPEIWKDLIHPDARVAAVAFHAKRRLLVSWRGIRFTRLETIDLEIVATGCEGLDLHWHLDDLPATLRSDFLNLWYLAELLGGITKKGNADTSQEA